MLVLDVEPQPVVDTHVLVGRSDQRKQCDKVPSPAAIKHLKMRDQQKQNRDIVAQAVFACENVKEFSAGEAACLEMLALTILTRLAEDLLMRGGPRDAGNRDGEDQQLRNLHPERRCQSKHPSVWMRKRSELLAKQCLVCRGSICE